MEKYPMAIVSAPGQVEFVQRTLPPLSEKDVLIRVRACSICGGDVHLYKGKHPFASLPAAIGHEIAGEVVEKGTAVTKVKIGDRLVVEPVITCGQCYFCAHGEYHLCQNIAYQYSVGQGGFTPYFITPEKWAHKIPDTISYEEAALIEPLAVAVHAVRKAEAGLGHDLAIFGAGGIGLLLLQVVRAVGGNSVFVIDIQDHRLKLAQELGASWVLNPEKEESLTKILQETGGLGVDRSFEAVGLEKTLRASVECLKKGGICVVIGLFEEPWEIKFPVNLFGQREIQVRGSRGYCWDFQKAINLVANRKVIMAPLISHYLPLSDLPKAFELLLDPEQKTNKVVMQI